MPDIIKETESCLSQITEGTGYSVYDIEYVKEGPNRYLRVYVDKDGGVGIDDCVYVSRKLEKMLDERDFIQQAYILEVSSPGINRRLKKEGDFLKFMGHIIDIKLYKPFNGQKEFRGELKCFLSGDITLVLPDKTEAVFALSGVASARLAAL